MDAPLVTNDADLTEGERHMRSITSRLTLIAVILVTILASVFAPSSASAQVAPWVRTKPIKFSYSNTTTAGTATAGAYATKDSTMLVGHTTTSVIDNDTTEYVSLRDLWPQPGVSTSNGASAIYGAHLMAQVTGGTAGADSFDVIFEPSPDEGSNYTASQITVQTVLSTWGAANVIAMRLITDADSNIGLGSIAGAPGGRFILRQQSNGGNPLKVLKLWIAYPSSIAVGNIQ